LQQQSKTRGQLTRFLLTRGLWLILAELTLIHLVFSFHSPWDLQLLESFGALGWAWKLLHVPGLVNATGMKAPLVIAVRKGSSPNPADRA
jgi:hypothetical protein